jgi:hypothetical protein
MAVDSYRALRKDTMRTETYSLAPVRIILHTVEPSLIGPVRSERSPIEVNDVEWFATIACDFLFGWVCSGYGIWGIHGIGILLGLVLQCRQDGF